MRIVYKSTWVQTILLLAVLFLGSTQALDVGIEVQRDVLYRATFNSAAVPSAALASIDLPLTGLLSLRIRVGLSLIHI